MIVKLGEMLSWETFRRRSIFVKAVRIKEDFLYETNHGWIQGHKGQWLVELGDRVRVALDDESFLRAYRPDRRAKVRI